MRLDARITMATWHTHEVKDYSSLQTVWNEDVTGRCHHSWQPYSYLCDYWSHPSWHPQAYRSSKEKEHVNVRFHSNPSTTTTGHSSANWTARVWPRVTFTYQKSCLLYSPYSNLYTTTITDSKTDGASVRALLHMDGRGRETVAICKAMSDKETDRGQMLFVILKQKTDMQPTVQVVGGALI